MQMPDRIKEWGKKEWEGERKKMNESSIRSTPVLCNRRRMVQLHWKARADGNTSITEYNITHRN